MIAIPEFPPWDPIILPPSQGVNHLKIRLLAVSWLSLAKTSHRFGYMYVRALWIQHDCDPGVSTTGSFYFTTPKGGNHLKITFLAVFRFSLTRYK